MIKSFLLVNHDNYVLESSSIWINLKPKFHAGKSPHLAILLVAMPRFNEKPESHPLKLSRNIPHMPANPRLPMALPSVLSLI